MLAHRQVTHCTGSRSLQPNGIGVKQRTPPLRNVKRSQNEMREVISWQQAAVGVAPHEGIPQIATVRSDSDAQTPLRGVV